MPYDSDFVTGLIIIQIIFSLSTSRYKIQKVYRLENIALWKQYWHRKQEMIEMHHAHNIKVRPLSPAVETEANAIHQQHHHQQQHGAALNKLSQGQLLTSSLNECYLFHGTDSVDTAELIAQHGFDERVGSLRGNYGAGCYFASQACKAVAYTSGYSPRTFRVRTNTRSRINSLPLSL